MRACSSLAVLFVATIPILTGCGGNPAPTVAPEPGARVRVTAPDVDGRRYDGTLVGLPTDTIVVDTLRVALASVTRLDMHWGRKSNWDKGLLYGGAGVGAVGLGLGIAWWADCGDSGGEWCPDEGWHALILAPIGFLAGGIVGAGVGALIRSDKWEEVPLDRLRVSVVPQGNGRFGLAASIAF